MSDSVDIWLLLLRHGLSPRRSGGRIRFFCPSCATDPRARKKGRTGSAAANVDGNPWICFRCDERGNARQLAVMLGEEDEAPCAPHAPPTRAPCAPCAPRPRSSTIAAGWEQILEATSDGSVDRVVSWCREVRGWPADVSIAVGGLDDVAWPLAGEGGGRSGEAIVRSAATCERRLLVAVRCHRGVVRSVARRWAEAWTPPSGGKSWSLPSRATGDPETWGGTWAYGSVPEAVHAAELGQPVYLVEGGPDWLAMSGLLAAHELPGVAIGWYNTTTARKLTEALTEALGALNLIAPRVVMIPDINEPRDGAEHGAGMLAALECAEILRGRAGVHLVELPAGDLGSCDLSDALARDGADRVLRLVRTARCLHAAPVPVQRAPVEISARLIRATIEATHTTTSARRSVVVVQIDAGAGKSIEALRVASSVCSGELAVPVNGRRPRGTPEDDWPPANRSVVFSTPSHALADEKRLELSEYVAAPPPSVHLRGMLDACAYATEARDVFPSVGRRGVCGWGEPGERGSERCELAHDCPGAREPSVARGEIAFAPHAMIGRLKADLVIVDESPGVVRSARIHCSELATLYACKLISRVRRWRDQNMDAGDAARMLADVVEPLARQHASDVSRWDVDPYVLRVTGRELAALVRGKESLEGCLVRGFGPDLDLPPAPFPSQIRAGTHFGLHWPSRSAFKALRSLRAQHLRLGPARPQDSDTAGPSPAVSVVLELDGSWSLEVLTVQELPPGPCVVLDATGDLTIDEWRAAYPDRRVVLRRLSVQGTSPAEAVWVRSSGLSRRALMADGNIRAPARVAWIVRRMAELTRSRPRFDGEPPTRLAVLTHRPIAEAFETGALAGLVDELARQHFEIQIGYFGRHDRGTNQFEEVAGLAVIGDAHANRGALEAEALMLGLDPESLSSRRAAVTCRQAIARARHLRRGPGDRVVLVFAGRDPPSVPGILWREERLPVGAHRAPASHDVVDMLVELELRECVIGRVPLALFDRTGTRWEAFSLATLSRSLVERAVKIVAARLDMIRRSVRTRTGMIGLWVRRMSRDGGALVVAMWLARHGLARGG